MYGKKREIREEEARTVLQIFNLGHTHTHIERVKSECITLLSWGGGLSLQLLYGRAVHCTELYVSLVCCSWILNNLGTRPMNNRTNDKDKTSWDHQSTTTSADCNNLIFSLGTLGRLLCAVSQYQCIPSNQQDDEKGRSRVFTLCINNADSMRTSADGASSAYTKCTKKDDTFIIIVRRYHGVAAGRVPNTFGRPLTAFCIPTEFLHPSTYLLRQSFWLSALKTEIHFILNWTWAK